MWHRKVVRAAAVPFAAGLLVAGGSAAQASPAPVPAAQIMVPADCDVSEGQPGATPSPGGHDSHGMVGGAAPTAEGQMDHSMPMGDGQMDHSMPMDGGQMDHSMPMDGGQMDHSMPMDGGQMDHSMPMEEGQMDHGAHDSHGAGSMATVAGPDSASRTLVLGGFAGINGAALAGAGLLRRRTSSRRERHTTARASAVPARRVTEGND